MLALTTHSRVQRVILYEFMQNTEGSQHLLHSVDLAVMEEFLQKNLLNSTLSKTIEIHQCAQFT